jgi:hypothetical protein
MIIENCERNGELFEKIGVYVGSKRTRFVISRWPVDKLTACNQWRRGSQWKSEAERQVAYLVVVKLWEQFRGGIDRRADQRSKRKTKRERRYTSGIEEGEGEGKDGETLALTT